MKVQRKGNIGKIILSSLTILVMFLMLLGCSGSDGAAGPAGAQGVQGVPGDPGAPGQNLLGQQGLADGIITAVTVPTPPAVEGTVVEFELLDAENGNLLSTLPADSVISFTYNKLGADGQWESYIIREGAITGANNVGSAAGNKPAITAPVRQATTQAGLSATVNKVVNLGGGKYSYTFTNTGLTTTNFTAPVTYAANATNRIGIQVAGGGAHYNTYKDFVPAGGPVTATRNIVTTAPCLECHQGGTFGFHHSGERNEVEYCVTCHNPASIDPNSGNSVDMANMVHKIHMGKNLPSVLAGTPYIIWGNNGSVHNYGVIGYPQDIINCEKCHRQVKDGTTVLNSDFEQWKKHPTRLACGACHDDVNFATGAGHGPIGGVRADDTMCAFCHDALNVEMAHVTPNATPNNPKVPAGAVNFTYEISAVTVNASSQAVVKFRVLKDGTAVTFNGAGTAPLTGFTGSPSFLLAFADGTDTTVDWNNKGNGVAAAQPASVSIATLLDGTRGTLGAPDASGYYTATIGTTTYTAANFPAGAKMRAVALQGYFTQIYTTDRNGDGVVTTADNLARHTVAAWKGVTGDTARRAVVSDEKCANCHEWFEGHGGNRVKTVAVCDMCHNPNLSSSGTTVNLAAAEATQNMKDMIHSIHASRFRTTAYTHNRAKSGANSFYDWSPTGNHPVEYPAALNSCEACHNAGTYESLPAGALWTTDVTTPGAGATTATITAARLTLPNPTDLVSSPYSSTCVACHDGTLAQAHIKANGGVLKAVRTTTTIEQCVICHGAGKTAAIKAVHAKTAAE